MTPTVVGEIGGSFGIGAVALGAVELLGLPLPCLAWGFVGGILGTGFAPPMGKWAACLTYASASLLSALGGYTIGDHLALSPTKTYFLVSVSSAVFHPLLNLIVQKLPALFDLWVPLGKKVPPA